MVSKPCSYCGGSKSFHHKDVCECTEECDCVGYTLVKNDLEWDDDEG